MKLNTCIILVIFLLTSTELSSSSINLCPENKKQKGNLNLIENYRIANLIEKQNEYNKENPGMMGFRIQFDLGHTRQEAMEIQAKLKHKYPELPTYIVYEQPYFKLRLGDFRTRLDVQYYFYKLSEEFGNIFIVPDRISLPELNN